MGRFSRLGNALYEGDVSVDFIGRKWIWYAVSAVMVLAAAGGLIFKGLDLGIEFQGGAQYTITAPAGTTYTQADVGTVTEAVAGAGIANAENPVVTLAGTTGIQVQTETVTNDQSNQLITAMAKAAGTPEDNISESAVGPAYGAQVAKQALTGLIVFLVLVVIFIWAYFREWKMSVAGLVALAHDIVITTGVYALSGFEVTPATVTGLLTILGFSLYDTVVVFDKVRENTRNLRASRTTYAQAANLAVNQTLVRSINTSIVALLPVAAILYVGITTLGAGPLKDLALSLFVGMAVGAYSSIFIATPLVVQLKSGEKEVTEAERRAKARARRDVDRYAAVPAYADDMPIADPPPPPAGDDEDGIEVDPAVPGRPVREARPAVDTPDAGEADAEPATTRSRRPAAVRDTPTRASGPAAPSKGPVGESRASGRNQPSRRTRSQRGKK